MEKKKKKKTFLLFLNTKINLYILVIIYKIFHIFLNTYSIQLIIIFQLPKQDVMIC